VLAQHVPQFRRMGGVTMNFKSIWCALAHRSHYCARIPEFHQAATGENSIPVYVINLRDSASRREHMKREMGKAGIPFTFIEAIRGADLAETAGAITRSETACALSHLHVLDLIARGPHEFAAIFEDDILVSPDTKLFLDERILRTLPRFDIMQLMFIMKHEGLAINIANVSSYGVCIRPRPSLGTQALVYRRSAAQRIVREISEISSQMDDMLFRRTDVFGLRIVSVSPAVVQHGEFQTTIRPAPALNRQRRLSRETARALTYLRLAASCAAAWTPGRGVRSEAPAAIAPPVPQS
jgi:GR25 family glycosyltransferase involved in LPS biosynthesis